MAIIARNAGLKINIFYPSVKMSDVMWIRSDICPTKMFKIDLPNLKLFFSENCLLDKMIPKNISTGKNALFLKSINILFFSGFSFYGHWRLTGQQGKGRDHFLFYSTTSTRSRTFRHCLQLCMWDDCCSVRFTNLSNYHLIDWWFEISFYLFTWWFGSRILLEI